MRAPGTVFSYAILTGQYEVTGGCGLIARIGPGGLEIGYWLHPGHTATEQLFQA